MVARIARVGPHDRCGSRASATGTPASPPIAARHRPRAAGGDVVGLAGPSEAGKTTLCLVVSGLAPRAIGGRIRGTIELDGEDVDAWPMYRLAERIGIGFQNPATQLSQVADTVFEEIAFGPMNLGLPRDEVAANERGSPSSPCASSRWSSAIRAAVRRSAAARGHRRPARDAAGAPRPRRADRAARPGRERRSWRKPSAAWPADGACILIASRRRTCWPPSPAASSSLVEGADRARRSRRRGAGRSAPPESSASPRPPAVRLARAAVMAAGLDPAGCGGGRG